MKDSMRKRSLKRKTAFLLAMSMVCSLTQTLNAGAVISGIGEIRRESSIPVTSETEPGQNYIGTVEVALSSTLFLSGEIEFTAELTNNSGYSKQETITLSSSSEEADKEQKIRFEGLADGNYTLTVQADNFTSYSQEIAVTQKLHSVKLTAGLSKSYTYDVNGLHPGLLMIGDLNKDNEVNDADKNILIDNIGTEKNTADLNNDGSTDIMDLTLLSQAYGEEVKDCTAKVEEFILPSAIDTKVDNAEVEGDIEKMLNGEETITLIPKEEISVETPMTIDFNMPDDENATKVDGITFATGSENPVSQATIDVEYVDEDGTAHKITVPLQEGIHHILSESEVYAEIDEKGNINVHLGAQVAVKKVSLRISAMQSNNNLAEISKVEFVNGMEERIPEPEMDIPENLSAQAGSEKFVLRWNACNNITGYEVKIELDGKSEVIPVVSNSIIIASFNNKDIKNYTTYKVSVQSVNGTWRSGYCDSVNVTPIPSKRPDKPDNVEASGGDLSINVRWDSMDDTRSYNVYYRLRNSDDEYTKISDVPGTSYKIGDLKALTEYEVYVTGVNHIGESPQSLLRTARTTDRDPAQVPLFNIINRDENGKPGSAHITSVTRNGGEMVASELDENSKNTAWGAVDGIVASYYTKNTWDDGGYNPVKGGRLGGDRGLTYTFDKEYTIDKIAVLTNGTNIAYAKMEWWSADGTSSYADANVQECKDSQGRIYYVITPKTSLPIKANKIHLGTGRFNVSPVTIAETYFYQYDSLKDEVYDIFADDLHTSLKESTTQEVIDDLRARVIAPDEHGVENVSKDALLRELEMAEKFLTSESMSDVIEINTGITSNDVGRGFTGLNAWQPIGFTAGAGETFTVYVGHNTKQTGNASDLTLVATQYHSESGGLTRKTVPLKIGANEITLDNGNSAGFENGGALYIQYSGKNAGDKYSIRIDGATEVPVLDLYKVTDEAERMERAVEYIEKLDEYTANMEALHNEIHKDSGNSNVDYDYDPKNCILGASDILLDTMMLSLPAQQIIAGTGSGTVEQRAEKMLNSMQAMEDMMYLFYQHKGLNADADLPINQIPKTHLNIRYQRMFSGAFMYAGGNHIGIEWGSTSSLMNGVPIVADENGKYVSGNYFGWGIAHEIGHNINQGSYAVAEITNNYFAQLAQAKDTNEGMRFQYKNIYDKVTSGVKGNCSNIATQLGMYWQLHLAYDKGLNYKTYADYNEQFNNLFYARVDTYARSTANAPKPDGTALNINKIDTDQALMRLACAASEKNVLEFFERWGKTPNADTIKYASQFEKETRAIQYANDDSRIYALNGDGGILGTDGSVSVIENISVNKGSEANKVELKFTTKDIPESDILGYEIIRCTISGGKTEEVPVGFAQGNTFTDTVTTMNNRTVFYKVTLIDQYLNRSEVYETKKVKIEHDGSMDKTNWGISLVRENVFDSPPVVVSEATEETPCDVTKNKPVEMAIDNDLNTAYTPKLHSSTAEMIIDFKQTVTATGFKYTAGTGTPIGAYEIQVLENDKWIKVAEGSFNGSKTVYFANEDNKYVSAYSITKLKLTIKNQNKKIVSIAELDVLGPTGDNVDFRRTQEEKTTVIGTLGEDYQYGTGAYDFIPAGSLVFTGSYKGNPAYNVIMMFDENGRHVGGYDEEGYLVANQIILADVPENSNITDVANGTWIYWIEPEYLGNMDMPETVRAELYRVNSADKNTGQRLVSDSLPEEMPATLPEITFGK